MDNGSDKSVRVLSIYSKLMNGYMVFKSEEAVNFGVNERTIQRDIDEIRKYLEQETMDKGVISRIVYDRHKKGYRLDKLYNIKLTNEEILAVSKILLASRAFTKDEMMDILKRLVDCCVPESNMKTIKALLANESFHYVELKHGKSFIGMMWEIGQAISKSKYIEIKYQGKQCSSVKTRKLKPLAILFSDYYFYLTAFIDDEKVRAKFDVINDSFPTIYRIDRIQELKILDEHFHIPYKDRFEEGEFRKRTQFMHGGRLRKIKFEYLGYYVESVLDRLPTARILSEDGNKYIIEAEVFGDGVDKWLRGHGEAINVLEEETI